MPGRKVHCEDCIRVLGEPFEQVHKWLDGLFDPRTKHIRHRIFRHNRKGIEEVRRMWGDRAAEAARLHILMDFGIPNTPDAPIPADEKEAAIVLAIWIQDQEARRVNPLHDLHRNPYEDIE